MPGVHRLDFLRADALARLGRVDEARQSYKRAIASYPNDGRAYANLAVLELLTGNRAAANELLRSLDRIDPQMAAKTREALQK
jgi:Flp pilus assembly protein TadD